MSDKPSDKRDAESASSPMSCSGDVHSWNAKRTKARLEWVSDELVMLEQRQILLRSHEADLLFHLENCLKK